MGGWGAGVLVKEGRGEGTSTTERGGDKYN